MTVLNNIIYYYVTVENKEMYELFDFIQVLSSAVKTIIIVVIRFNWTKTVSAKWYVLLMLT